MTVSRKELLQEKLEKPRQKYKRKLGEIEIKKWNEEVVMTIMMITSVRVKKKKS